MKKRLWKRKIIWIPLLVILIILITVFFYFKTILGNLEIFLGHTKELFGDNEEKKYLILFQNNNELRPSGGFISAYGILDIKDGNINLYFADSYNLTNTTDLPDAPKPFNIFLDDSKFKGWYFRDSNFDIDFRDAAEDIEDLFWQQSNKSEGNFDGIIAVNFELLEDIVEIYKIEIDGIKLNRENLFSTLENKVKNIDTHNIYDLQTRKNILSELTTELINEAKFAFSKYDDILEAINNGLEKKKILLFFKDEKLQEIAEEQGWAGRVDPENYTNFIHTNIANIGGRKSDRYVQKNHKYFVDFSKSNQGQVTYTLSLEHFGDYNLNSDIYKAYIQVLTTSKDFEKYITISPGTKKEVVFKYSLPKTITQENFELDLIKQSGTKDLWEVIVKVPGENSFESANLEVKENLGFWTEYLLADKHFELQYLNDNISPVVVWQEFNELNLIGINFSEDLDESFLDPDNYEIIDQNYINNYTDKITVKNIYLENNNVYLETSGITIAEEERYIIKLKNLKDLSKNPTNPEVMEITVVQRL